METFLNYRYYSPVKITSYPFNKKSKCIECADNGDQTNKDIVLSGENENGRFDYCKKCLTRAIWRLRRDKSLSNEEILTVIEKEIEIREKQKQLFKDFSQ